LWRNPTHEELTEYSDKILNNTEGFDADTLRTLLYTSDEYRRLEKTQSNMARTNLMGDITDRQLSLLVKLSYAKVYGDEKTRNDLDHDDVYLEYLKRRYIDAMYDATRFEMYLRNMQKAHVELTKKDVKSKTTYLSSDSKQTNDTSTSSKDNQTSPSPTSSTGKTIDVLVRVNTDLVTCTGNTNTSSNGLPMTPLSEAKNTSVGSILPPLPPRG
jgi:hypothetical protein